MHALTVQAGLDILHGAHTQAPLAHGFIQQLLRFFAEMRVGLRPGLRPPRHGDVYFSQALLSAPFYQNQLRGFYMSVSLLDTGIWKCDGFWAV